MASLPQLGVAATLGNMRASPAHANPDATANVDRVGQGYGLGSTSGSSLVLVSPPPSEKHTAPYVGSAQEQLEWEMGRLEFEALAQKQEQGSTDHLERRGIGASNSVMADQHFRSWVESRKLLFARMATTVDALNLTVDERRIKEQAAVFSFTLNRELTADEIMVHHSGPRPPTYAHPTASSTVSVQESTAEDLRVDGYTNATIPGQQLKVGIHQQQRRNGCDIEHRSVTSTSFPWSTVVVSLRVCSKNLLVKHLLLTSH